VANHLQRAKGKWPTTCKEQKASGQPPAKRYLKNLYFWKGQIFHSRLENVTMLANSEQT